MPQLDGTGPRGEGKMTGRGLGNCDTGNTQNKNLGRGRGLGRGLGQGRGQAKGRRKGPNGITYYT